MKRCLASLMVILVVISLMIGESFALDQLEVKIPEFKVTLNNVEIDSSVSQYPLIVYNYITYFPMTWSYARGMGLETVYSEERGLVIRKANKIEPIIPDTDGNNDMGKVYYATVPEFLISVNGKQIDNAQEEYPLFVFRDITYFPLTWRFAVEEFGWKYTWSEREGLSVNADNRKQSEGLPVNEETKTQIEVVKPSFVSAGGYHTVYLDSDGKAISGGISEYGQCNVKSWENIVSVSAGYYHTVGLKSDGTVVAAGDNYFSQCTVYGWTNIVNLSAGWDHTVGVKSDGTVVAVGLNDMGQCKVFDWRDIIIVSADFSHTVGLKSDGTVVATGENNYGQCNVTNWIDVTAISAGGGHTVGLKSDGTVVAKGDNDSGQCNVSKWEDIIAVSAGTAHTVGLKSDGTVIATGDNSYGQCNISTFEDIVAISAGVAHTAVYKSDGTVKTIGNYFLLWEETNE